MGDEDALLLAARETAHPSVGEALGVDVDQHPLDKIALRFGPTRETKAVCVQAQGHEVAGAYGHVGVQADLLRHVTERASVLRQGRAVHADLPRVEALQSQDGAKQGGLSHTVRPDESRELTGPDLKGDVVENFATRERDAHVIDVKNGCVAQSFSVDEWCSTAFSMALSSAIIHVW